MTRTAFIHSFLFSTLLLASQVASQQVLDDATPANPSNVFSNPDGTWSVSYRIEGSRIRLRVIADTDPTQTWIGFGISPTGGMRGADMVLGTLPTDTPEGLVMDFFAPGQTTPVVDTQQDLSDATVWLGPEGGRTKAVMDWVRPLRVQDRDDVSIVPGRETTLLWAMGPMTNGQPGRHTVRGSMSVTFQLDPANPSAPTTPSTPPSFATDGTVPPANTPVAGAASSGDILPAFRVSRVVVSLLATCIALFAV